MKERIVTIDIEGDLGDKARYQKLFPNGNHQDPDTQIWCATLSWYDIDGIQSKTFVAKLPPKDKQRILKDGKPSGTWHDEETVVKDKYYTHKYGWVENVIECDDELGLIAAILSTIMDLSPKAVYSKGYLSVNYDYTAILNSIKRLKGQDLSDEIDGLYHKLFRDATVEFPQINKLWERTSEQIQKGSWEQNQKYMAWGISHNIEDSRQLLELINKLKTEQQRIASIKGDF